MNVRGYRFKSWKYLALFMLCVLVSDIKGCLEFRPGIATLFYVNECHLLVVVSAVATCISQQFPDLKLPTRRQI